MLSAKPRDELLREGGFTVIEALIAVALVSVLLASIASLVASNARSTRGIEQHVALLETARLIVSSLPREGEPLPATMAGQLAGFAWQMRVLPFRGSGPPVSDSPFVPKVVELKIKSPSGAGVLLETIRLQNRNE